MTLSHMSASKIPMIAKLTQPYTFTNFEVTKSFPESFSALGYDPIDYSTTDNIITFIKDN